MEDFALIFVPTLAGFYLAWAHERAVKRIVNKYRKEDTLTTNPK
jgi:hypothetical protein